MGRKRVSRAGRVRVQMTTGLICGLYNSVLLERAEEKQRSTGRRLGLRV